MCRNPTCPLLRRKPLPCPLSCVSGERPHCLQTRCGCIGCMAAHCETIGQGAGAHGLDVDAVVSDINKKIAEQAE